MADQYPDLSMPIGHSSEWPDLSSPLSTADQLSSMAEEQKVPDKEGINTFIGKLPEVTKNNFKQKLLSRISNEQIKSAGSALLPLAAPEIKSVPVISNLLSKIPGATGVGNALGRIGYGTGINTVSDVLNPNNNQNLSKDIHKNLLLNSLLEAPAAVYRAPAALGELFNPLEYGIKKSNEIKNEATAMQALTNEKYRPVNEKYDDHLMTVSPEKYLDSAGIDPKSLYADAKIRYQKFINHPTFGNLHDLQSKIGQDWARISKSPVNEEKAQLFNQMRESIKDKMKNFLSNDPIAKKQYEEASDFAKNNLFPYYATPTLKSIAKGKLTHAPQLLSKTIQKGIDKTVGKEEKSVIPEGHPLRQHLNDINHRLNVAKASQYVLPTVGGAVGGELLSPGLGGVLSGIGASQIPNIAYRLGAPSLTGFVQNPVVKNIFNKTEPYYYRGGRLGINAFNKS